MESDALPNSLDLPLPEMMVDEAILTVWESKTDRRANLGFSNRKYII